jgi:hypothetical protein
VIVGVLIFAIFFYEATQIKLKQQEAERYVAWEFTGKQLTDYSDSSDRPNIERLTGEAIREIPQEALARYRSLISPKKAGRTINASHYVMTAWSMDGEPTVRNDLAREVPGGLLGQIAYGVASRLYSIWDAQTFSSSNSLHQTMMAGSQTTPQLAGGAIGSAFDAAALWGFNTKGQITVNPWPWRIVPTIFMPRNYLDDRFDNIPFRQFAAKTLAGSGVVLIVDHWNLQDGRAISGQPGAETSSGFRRQLNRMAFVTKESQNLAASVSTQLTLELSAITQQLGQSPLRTNPMEVALTSVPYGDAAGTRTLALDRGPVAFDTAPFARVYQMAHGQRGPYFMGCQQPENLGCRRSLDDNPFGEWIVHEKGK